MIIDTQFNVFSDTPLGKDPDKYSPTLRRYHQYLWSKPLPDGNPFTLEIDGSGSYLYHGSTLGEFHLSSDAISNTHRHVARMTPITSLVPTEVMADFYNLGSTIGAYIVFPRKMINGKQNINQARGCHPKIRDRIDLTLECIRRFYVGQVSPLSTVLERYGDFFTLFQSFDGYVDFFLLNDLVKDSAVKFLLPFDEFQRDGYPVDVAEYQYLMCSTMDFLNERNQRIAGL
ncbi:DUF6994 family protein [Falsihalocynthiibacter arcticus]|uniref:DUF6994 family protein n=1 Tax=Falsihalocynthiibacter arcticus TaxID=1579316 RepID=UPI0030039927